MFDRDLKYMKYRGDIDGLRAIAVFSVIFFHIGFESFGGGYIGVDIFFVISGYLITTLIYKEMNAGEFTFTTFYKRRIARILPSLSITLLVIFAFGFVFYNNKSFDVLGKEVFFSSFGAANILFARGVDYFAQEVAHQPLIHLWSLGVEEQFYLLWPIVILTCLRFSKKLIYPVTLVFFLVSLYLSVVAVNENLTKGYFLLHYRAFELLIGAMVAFVAYKRKELNIPEVSRQLLSYLGLGLVIAPVFLLEKDSSFPGFNALWPCFGTALIIYFPNQGLVTRILSNRILVFLGLISYPLYLFHQPIISFMHFFGYMPGKIEALFFVTILGSFLAWLTFRFVEKPIRKAVHSKNKKVSNWTAIGWVSTIPLFVSMGAFVAISDGFEGRFKFFNPFAFEISQAHANTFLQKFSQGYRVSKAEHGTILLIGDSVLQHYVMPIQQAIKLDLAEIDVVSRGGCVLLKDVDFSDVFATISCNDLRHQLYESKKTYDVVVLSQLWESYDTMVNNFMETDQADQRWQPFLEATIAHFRPLAKKIVIIGAHPEVEGSEHIQPSMIINKAFYQKGLAGLKVKNLDYLQESRKFFVNYEVAENVIVIHPQDVFCSTECELGDEKWSFFTDTKHLTYAANDFVASKISIVLEKQLVGPAGLEPATNGLR